MWFKNEEIASVLVEAESDFWYTGVSEPQILAIEKSTLFSGQDVDLDDDSGVNNAFDCKVWSAKVLTFSMYIRGLRVRMLNTAITTVREFVSRLVLVGNETELLTLCQTVHPWIVNQFYGGAPRGLSWTQAKLARVAA